MKAIFLLVLLCLPAFAKPAPRAVVLRIKKEIEQKGLPRFSEFVDEAIAANVKKAVINLDKRGFHEEAYRVDKEFERDFRGYVHKAYFSGRHIMDHKPLLDWLAKLTKTLTDKIGMPAMKATHLSDLITLNYTIPVVFMPCTFSLDGLKVDRESEYRRHFAKDDGADQLYGLFPVVCFWAIEAGCMVGTTGIAGLVCGPAAMAGEWIAGKFVGPFLSDKIFVAVCDH